MNPGAATAKLDDGDVHDAVARVLRDHLPSHRSISAIERRPSAFCSSFVLEEIDVWLDDHTMLPLVLKVLGRPGLLPTARKAKPAFLADPRREIEAYRLILAPNSLGTARFYGAIVDSPIERYWLFLERVPGLDLRYIGSFDTWRRVTCWLADFHRHFAAGGDRLGPSATRHLLRYDGNFYRRWLSRARRFVQLQGDGSPPDVRRRFDQLAPRYDRIVERLISLPTTLIHGELYPANVRLHHDAGRDRVCAVDWELASIAPGLVDLAALTSGQWSEEQKRALALTYYETYYERSASHDSSIRGLREFLTNLDCCRLHLALQWLGWSLEWSPPLDQTQDWLAEALAVAERLFD